MITHIGSENSHDSRGMPMTPTHGIQNVAEIRNQIHIPESEVSQNILWKLILNNPAFIEAEKAGRSTRDIDEKIYLYRRSSGMLILPWGCKFALQQKLKDCTETNPKQIPFFGELRDYQEKAISELHANGGGVLVAATGAGKTITAIGLASKLSQRTLILVKSKDLADQWRDAILRFTGLKAGQIGGGKNIEGDEFTIALIQTMAKRPPLSGYGSVICDEAHNVPAMRAYKVITQLNARYRFGLSATPQRRDNMEPALFAALGPITSRITESSLKGAVLPVQVIRQKISCFESYGNSWTKFVKGIGSDMTRNRIISEKAIKASQMAGTIVLCGSIEQCENITALCPNALLIHGQLPKSVRTERMALASSSNLIIGTLSLLSEGIDLPHLTNLIFATPVSASVDREAPAATRLVQSIGRTRRPYPGKSEAFVLDLIDDCPIGKSAARKRLEVYQRNGFNVLNR
jgi:superfamily II DNA or RNA helicase